MSNGILDSNKYSSQLTGMFIGKANPTWFQINSG